MGVGTAAPALPAGPVRLRIRRKTTDASNPIAARRFVYCWERSGDAWKSKGILLSDDGGILYTVEKTLREEYVDLKNKVAPPSGKKGKPDDSRVSPEGKMVRVSSPPIIVFADNPDIIPFRIKPKSEYFLAFFPADLILHPDYAGDSTDIREWAESNAELISKPPAHWLKNPECYGVKTTISSAIIRDGLVLPCNWLEWLGLLRQDLRKFNRYLTITAARKQPYLQAISYLDIIAAMLESTAAFPSGSEPADELKRLAREYGLSQLHAFSSAIQKKYIPEAKIQGESQAIKNFVDIIIGHLKDQCFKTAFFRYSATDRYEDTDPVRLMKEERVDEIVTSAYASIPLSPADQLVKAFYATEILCAELNFGQTLAQEELDAIRDALLKPQTGATGVSREPLKDFCSVIVPILDDKQKRQFSSAVMDALAPTISPVDIGAIEKKIAGFGALYEDSTTENPLWEYIKDGAQEHIDTLLESFQGMREAWITEELDNSVQLSRKALTSVRWSVLYLRAIFASYKNGKGKRSVRRAAGKYIGSVFSRLLDPRRLLKASNADEHGSTPTNINMAFSAIGMISGVLDISAFLQKKEDRSLDDWIDFYQGLTSVSAGILGFMPEKAPLFKLLREVFKVPAAIGDIGKAITLMEKARLYYAQKRFEKSTYSMIEGAYGFISAGLTIFRLIRWKAITRYLVKKGLVGMVLADIPIINFAYLGMEISKMLFNLTEPAASKKAIEIVTNGLDPLIHTVPGKPMEYINKSTGDITILVPKIDYSSPELTWHDTGEFNGKEIYCDENRTWDWLKLRELIAGEMSVMTWKGMGWTSQYDREKVLIDLMNRGVPPNIVGAVVGKKEEEVEREHRNNAAEKQKALIDSRKKSINIEAKKSALQAFIT